MPTAALTLESVTRRFRAGVPGCSAEVTALTDVSLHVARGECVGVAGSAGSGKTTLLMCAAGLLAPDAGTVRSARCAYASAHGVAHPFLGVRASLEFAASVRELEGDSTEPDIDGLLAQTGLSELGRSRIGTLTPGMRARTVVAHLLLGAPRVLCIDDPLSALSAVERLHFASLLQALCSEGVAVILSARDPALCDGVANRVVLLQGGRVIEARRARRRARGRGARSRRRAAQRSRHGADDRAHAGAGRGRVAKVGAATGEARGRFSYRNEFSSLKNVSLCYLQVPAS